MTDELPAAEPVQRLQQVAHAALAQFGFAGFRLALVQHLVNTTFRMDCATGRYLVRVHRNPQRTVSQIRSELTWLRALAEETQLLVQEPMATPQGAMVVVIDASGAAYPVSVLRWVEGEMLPQTRRSVAHFVQLGRVVARLHTHAQCWTPPIKIDRPVYDARGVEAMLDGSAMSQASRHAWTHLREQFSVIEQRMARTPANFGLIHADLSFGNVLFAKDHATPIDFEDCGFGYYLFDLAVILAGPWSRPGFAARKDALLEGYRESHAVDAQALVWLPTFMAVRAALLGQWERVQTLLDLSYESL